MRQLLLAGLDRLVRRHTCARRHAVGVSRSTWKPSWPIRTGSAGGGVAVLERGRAQPVLLAEARRQQGTRPGTSSILVSGQSATLDPAATAQADGPAVFDSAHRHAAFILHGDVFVVDWPAVVACRSRARRRRSSATSSPLDGRALQYRDGNDWYSYDLAVGVVASAAASSSPTIRRRNSPTSRWARQLELFKTLRQLKADKQAQREQDKTLTPPIPACAATVSGSARKLAPVDTELSPVPPLAFAGYHLEGRCTGKAPELTRRHRLRLRRAGRRARCMSAARIRRRSRCCCSTWSATTYPLRPTLPGAQGRSAEGSAFPCRRGPAESRQAGRGERC